MNMQIAVGLAWMQMAQITLFKSHTQAKKRHNSCFNKNYKKVERWKNRKLRLRVGVGAWDRLKTEIFMLAKKTTHCRSWEANPSTSVSHCCWQPTGHAHLSHTQTGWAITVRPLTFQNWSVWFLLIALNCQPTASSTISTQMLEQTIKGEHFTSLAFIADRVRIRLKYAPIIPSICVQWIRSQNYALQITYCNYTSHTASRKPPAYCWSSVLGGPASTHNSIITGRWPFSAGNPTGADVNEREIE